MTMFSGGIGGFPPAPPVDCATYVPTPVPASLMVEWTDVDQITVTPIGDPGSLGNAETITIIMEGQPPLTIPINDPHVTVNPDGSITIDGISELFPDAPLPYDIIGVTVNTPQGVIGLYDGNEGLPPGEYLYLPPADETFDALYGPPLTGDGSGHIDYRPQGSCGPVGARYYCESGAMILGALGLFNGDVFTVDILTEDGLTTGVAVEGQQIAPLWLNSSAYITDAASYGEHWLSLTFRNVNGDVLCIMTEPQQTWNGGPWTLTEARCQTGPQPPTGFTALYDSYDYITLTAASPGLFNDVAFTRVKLIGGEEGTPIPVFLDGEHVRLYNMSGVFPSVALPQNIQEIELYDSGNVSLGIWTGSIVLNKRMVATSVASGGCEEFTIDGRGFTDGDFGPTDTVRLVTPDFSTFYDFDVDTPIPGRTINVLNDNTIVVSSPDIAGIDFKSIVVASAGGTDQSQSEMYSTFQVSACADPDLVISETSEVFNGGGFILTQDNLSTGELATAQSIVFTFANAGNVIVNAGDPEWVGGYEPDGVYIGGGIIDSLGLDGDQIIDAQIYDGLNGTGTLLADYVGGPVNIYRLPSYTGTPPWLATGPCSFHITGTNLDVADRLIGTFSPFGNNDMAYNPAGPNAGLNATLLGGRGVTVNQWTSTDIDLTFGPGPAFTVLQINLSNSSYPLPFQLANANTVQNVPACP